MPRAPTTCRDRRRPGFRGQNQAATPPHFLSTNIPAGGSAPSNPRDAAGRSAQNSSFKNFDCGEAAR